MTARTVADHEDQAANRNQRKDQPIHQFEGGSAIAGKHHPGCCVLVEQELVNRIEPVENGKQGDEVEQPAVGPSHSGVPGQEDNAGPNRKPRQARADLERENSKDDQDYSESEVFARKALSFEAWDLAFNTREANPSRSVRRFRSSLVFARKGSRKSRIPASSSLMPIMWSTCSSSSISAIDGGFSIL